MQNLKRIGTYLFVITLFTVLFLFIVKDFRFDSNEFCYPMDDAFIHMAISKNLAENCQYGITRHEFTSSSSSPVYSLLLAGVMKIAEPIYSPLILNFIISIIILIYTLHFFEKNKIGFLAAVFGGVAIILFTPLPAVASLGMEHTLHILSSLLIFITLYYFIESPSSKLYYILTALVAVSVLIRYENFAIFGLIFLYLFFKYSKQKAVIFVLIAIIPFVLFGIFSVANGAFFVPNSIFVKGSKSLSLYIMNPLNFLTVTKYPQVAVIFYLHLAVFLLKQIVAPNLKDNRSLLAGFIFILTLAHVAGAVMGQLYRYEAYLVFLNLLSGLLILYIDILPLRINIFKKIFNAKRTRKMLRIYPIDGLVIIVAIFVVNLFFINDFKFQIYDNYALVKRAAANIHDQQYQTAKFVARYYPEGKIAANDIGAITYFNDIKLFDLLGLGSNEKIRLKLAGKPYGVDAIEENSKNADFAVIYDSWIKDRVPRSWQKAATWQLPDNFGLGDSIISFYAVQDDSFLKLKSQLKEFEPSLPARVFVKYFEK